MPNSDQFLLIDQGNPLLAPFLPERSFRQWAEDLYFDPVPNRSTAGLQISESHLHLVEQVFIPTQRSIELAMSLAAMMISSLRRRDLIDAYVRKDLKALAQSFTDQPIAFLRDIWALEQKRREEGDE